MYTYFHFIILPMTSVGFVFVQNVGSCSSIYALFERGMPLKQRLDVMHFSLTDCGHVEVRSGPAHVYSVGVIMSQTTIQLICGYMHLAYEGIHQFAHRLYKNDHTSSS